MFTKWQFHPNISSITSTLICCACDKFPANWQPKIKEKKRNLTHVLKKNDWFVTFFTAWNRFSTPDTQTMAWRSMWGGAPVFFRLPKPARGLRGFQFEKKPMLKSMESSGRKSKGGFRFAIDRGGTFTDVFAHCPNGKIRVLKLLSSDPENYNDAPVSWKWLWEVIIHNP